MPDVWTKHLRASEINIRLPRPARERKGLPADVLQPFIDIARGTSVNASALIACRRSEKRR